MIKKALAMMRYLYAKATVRGLVLTKISFLGQGAVLWCKAGGTIHCKGKVRLDKAAEAGAVGELVLGDRFVLNPYARVVAFERITIGDNVMAARFVAILDHDHAFGTDQYETAPISIGNNVWLGDKVTVLKGVTIGDNVTIAANSVVTKDIPANTIAGGVPAKVLKQRDGHPVADGQAIDTAAVAGGSHRAG